MRKPVRVLPIVVFSILCAAPAAAQTDDRVEVDPIQCWWRTDAGDVRIGEPFSVLLTCSLLETSSTRAILDEGRLDPAAIQLQPFDVLGGRRARDLTAATRRFIQFDYTVRVIADVFGSQAVVPSVQLTYRIESRAGTDVETAAGEVVRGRELTYAMPPLAIRVISTVPEGATDIREVAAPGFAGIERTRFRGTLLRAVAGLAALVALLFGLSALLPAVRRRQPADPAAVPGLADAAILAAVRRELTDALEQGRATTWPAATLGRVLSALRIAAAYGLGQPVARVRAAEGHPAPEGHLAVRTRAGVALVAAATTPAAIESRPDLAPLKAAMDRCTAARYGRDPDGHLAGLEEAVEGALEVIGRLAGGYTWRARRAAALRHSIAGARERLWAR